MGHAVKDVACSRSEESATRVRLSRGQKASEEMTSPPAMVPRAHQTGRLTVPLTNRTVPSPNRTLIPPEWRLVA